METYKYTSTKNVIDVILYNKIVSYELGKSDLWLILEDQATNEENEPFKYYLVIQKDKNNELLKIGLECMVYIELLNLLTPPIDDGDIGGLFANNEITYMFRDDSKTLYNMYLVNIDHIMTIKKYLTYKG